ncbi:TLC domain-containing protein 2-like isoform X2 [Lycorma delicatula]|uniref:TLC domain-containing protein 2-like isoform X2 n=1 Tax=Lycorma delicatula TaxID=130591 RepID=UPI003F519E9F
MSSVNNFQNIYDINIGYIVAFLSFLLFFSNSIWVLSAIVPTNARKSKHQEWKWRNIANSLVHSIITGCGACIYFWQYPEMGENLIYIQNYASHFLLALSTGYFIYDFLDMVIHDLKPKTYTLLVHHVLVVLGFGVALTSYRYQGYTLCSLFIEINSVFLHIRQLMLIQGWGRDGILYRINNSFNLGTFVIFRFLTMGWLTRFLIQHRHDFSTVALRVAALVLGHSNASDRILSSK